VLATLSKQIESTGRPKQSFVDIFIIHLSVPYLLKKCVHGRTQNVMNLFIIILTRIPKNTFVGLTTLQIGVWDSTINFNSGSLGKIKVMEELCKDAGRNCLLGLLQIGKMSLLGEAKKANKKENLQKKREKRNLKRKREEKEEESCHKYGAGEF